MHRLLCRGSRSGVYDYIGWKAFVMEPAVMGKNCNREDSTDRSLIKEPDRIWPTSIRPRQQQLKHRHSAKTLTQIEVQMRKSSVKPTEHKCPECNGTGFPMVMQPVKPGRRIYPIQCKNCGGKGRIVGTAN